jgi:hypothetical protein
VRAWFRALAGCPSTRASGAGTTLFYWSSPCWRFTAGRGDLTAAHPLPQPVHLRLSAVLRTTRWMIFFAATSFALLANTAFAFENAPIGLNLAKLLYVQLDPPEVCSHPATGRANWELISLGMRAARDAPYCEHVVRGLRAV